MNNKNNFSFGSRLKSFVYAFNGIKSLLRTEHNSWLHITAAVIAVSFGMYLKISHYEWCLLALAIGIVLISEILNTAIELLTDIVSPGYNEKAKLVKDLAAGGVLIASIVSLVIGAFIFIPKL